MSGSLVERQVMTEFLELYRDFPCLWYQAHSLYNNREAREQAYIVLLEKYKSFQEDANLETIKKKIDNMRCAYKRERRKVLTSIAEGIEEHKPTLWYYKLLSFIDSNEDLSIDTSVTVKEDYDFGDHEEYPKRKKVKKEMSAVYLPEINEEDGTVTQSHGDILHESSDYEAESFGRTVGHQLKDLQPMQRYIAEKLISDTIFYGRMDKLTMQSNVSLSQH